MAKIANIHLEDLVSVTIDWH